MQIIRAWWQKYFSENEAIVLVLLLTVSFLAIVMMGDVLGPVLASLVLSYLLHTLVKGLIKIKVNPNLALYGVYIGFLTLFLVGSLLLAPILWHQFIHLFQELPKMLLAMQDLLNQLSQTYPEFFSQSLIDDFSHDLLVNIKEKGNRILKASLTWLPNVVIVIIYLILVPLMVFFFLHDKEKLTKWLVAFLPEEKKLLSTVWHEIDYQMGNYIRGKIVQILLVFGICYLTFKLFGLNYAAILAFLIGIGVVVPYLGQMLAMIPLFVVAFFQWGVNVKLAYLGAAFGFIHLIDANIIVPLLFSEAVSLHPIAIIVSILFFGGLYGFWGVFFAIPLAIIIKAVLEAWPNSPHRRLGLS
jgi:putative permease